MKNITVAVDHRDYLGLEVFDYLVGYWQYITNYQITPTVTFGEPEDNCYNVLFLSMPEAVPDDLNRYDLILLDNGDEPYGIGTPAMHKIFHSAPQSKMLCNGILPTTHPAHGRIIVSHIMWEVHRRYYTTSPYPQRYEFINQSHNSGIVYINGKNLSVRAHLTQVLQQHAPGVAHHDIIHHGAVGLTRPVWDESNIDRAFRLWADQTYANNVFNQHPPEIRWPPMPAGVDGRYGQTLWEDQFLNVFRQNSIIVYPETTWSNQQISLNEKSLKCFLHQKFPMMVGGAYTHQMYNSLGFATAWNLLPPEHQQFDSILDHRERYIQQALATDWLSKNLGIGTTALAQTLLLKNQARSIVYSSLAGQQLYQTIHA